jgi:hypothetical protein
METKTPAVLNNKNVHFQEVRFTVPMIDPHTTSSTTRDAYSKNQSIDGGADEKERSL